MDHKKLTDNQSVDESNPDAPTAEPDDEKPVETPEDPKPQHDDDEKSVPVTEQPKAAPPAIHHLKSSGDHYLMTSVISTIFYLFCGCWCGLLCTVPAIIYATYAKEEEKQGNIVQMRKFEKISLNLNIAAFATYLVLFSLYIILIILSSVFGTTN